MNVQPICSNPVDGSMETGSGLRLCCNPAHDAEIQSGRGPVWHRIADWPVKQPKQPKPKRLKGGAA